MNNKRTSPDYDYIAATFAAESGLLREVRAKGEELSPGMQVSPVEGRLLAWMVGVAGAANILEIGTFVGYSTLWMASALPEGGKIITLEADIRHAEIAAGFFERSDKNIDILQGKALGLLDSQFPISDSRFDLIFIDAAKAEYPEYLEKVTPMLRTGGLLVADNTLLFGAVFGQPRKNVSATAIEAIKKFNNMLANNDVWDSTMIPTIEGLTIARKKT